MPPLNTFPTRMSASSSFCVSPNVSLCLEVKMAPASHVNLEFLHQFLQCDPAGVRHCRMDA